MGSGKNGTFDKHPEWQQWAILAVNNKISVDDLSTENHIKKLLGSFVNKWVSFFKCETWTVVLKAIEGHGLWDGKEVFGQLPKTSDYNGTVAVLTRATIRLSKLAAFWKNVDPVANRMTAADGFIMSLGIGELPYIKQATFSVWRDKEAMKSFAYQMKEHAEVIWKTRKENWYSEDMFVRFIPLKTFGNIKGNDPLAGKL